jgi:3-isopropylmalate dehydrogenase
LAAIGAGALLFREIGEEAAAAAIENSIRMVVTTKLKDLAAGKMGYSTTEVGDLVVKHL